MLSLLCLLCCVVVFSTTVLHGDLQWSSTGPWIVSLEERITHDHAIKQAKSIHSLYTDDKLTRHFEIKHAFRGQPGSGRLNAVVMEGVHREDLEKMEGVKSVYPDLVMEASWTVGPDRIDQADLPLTYSYDPDFHGIDYLYSAHTLTYIILVQSLSFVGCGVDVYVMDTGLDTTHSSFSSSSSSETRNVSNIYSLFTRASDGLSDATDANNDYHGHGTHCAGSVGGTGVIYSSTIGVATCSNIYGMKVG